MSVLLTKAMILCVSCFLLLIHLPVVSSSSDADKAGEQIKRSDGIHMALKILGFDSASKITPQTELKVLGSGLPRTGTKSTKAALERLGYKVMHMEDVLELSIGPSFVYGFVSDKSLDLLVKKMLSLGYNATVDAPFSGMVFRFSKLFPNAKILHTVRDQPEDWVRSFITLQSAFRFIWSRPMRWITSVDWAYPAFFEAAYGFITEFTPCEKDEFPWLQKLPWFDCASARTVRLVPDGAQAYRDWDKKVKEAFKEKAKKGDFLEFHVRQGWDPLVKFLGIKENPSSKGVTFPHVNEASTLQAIEYTFIFLSAVWPLALVVGALFGLWALDKMLSMLKTITRRVLSK